MRHVLVLLFSLIVVDGASQVYQWSKTFGGSGFDYGAATAVDHNGNIYVTGRYSGTVDFDAGAGTFNLTSLGNSDVFVVKLDPSGNFLWAKSMGGINDDEATAIAVDATGNVYCAGNIVNGGDFDPGSGELIIGGPYDIFIVKLDGAGNLVWGKSVGGGSYDFVFSIAIDAACNVYTTGHFEGGGDYDPGPNVFTLYSPGGYNGFILKLDVNGNFLWAKEIQSSNLAEGKSVVVDPSGNAYITGVFQQKVDFDPGDEIFELTAAGAFDIFIVKLNSSGNFIWAVALGGPGQDDVACIHLDSDKNILVTGSYAGIIDMDPGPGELKLTTNGLRDIFLTKLDNTGKLIWSKGFGGSDNDWGNSIATDPAKNIIVAGVFSSFADLNPGEGKDNITSKGEFDGFIVKLSANGEYMWNYTMGSAATDNLVIAPDATATLVATGSIGGGAKLNEAIDLEAFASYDVVVFKIDPTITGIPEEISTGTRVYPNPSKDFVNIESSSFKGAQYKIIDLLGRQIGSGSLEGSLTTVDISTMTPGLFVLTIELGDRRSCVKLLKL